MFYKVARIRKSRLRRVYFCIIWRPLERKALAWERWKSVIKEGIEQRCSNHEIMRHKGADQCSALLGEIRNQMQGALRPGSEDRRCSATLRPDAMRGTWAPRLPKRRQTCIPKSDRGWESIPCLPYWQLLRVDVTVSHLWSGPKAHICRSALLKQIMTRVTKSANHAIFVILTR